MYQLRTETGQRTKRKILEIFPPASGRTRKAVIQNQVTEGSAGADLGEGPAAPLPPSLFLDQTEARRAEKCLP